MPLANVADNCMDAGYNANYGNPDAGYAGNHYPASYSLNPVSVAILCEFIKTVGGEGCVGGWICECLSFLSQFQVQSGAESFPPYGAGPGSWGAYEMQRAQGHR